MNSIERHGGGLVVELCYGVQQLLSPVGDVLCWGIKGRFITNLGWIVTRDHWNYQFFLNYLKH